MMNQRNYYRILHVQMDAPDSVIKSAHRTMMQTLGQHPDLGGDDWNAGLLNEARAVLLDPTLRAQYDNKLLAAGYDSSKLRERGVRESAGGTPNRFYDAEHRESVDSSVTEHLPATSDDSDTCTFCHSRILWKPQQSHSYSAPFNCTRCDSPLTKVDDYTLPTSDDRRRINRSYFEFCARIWLAWPLDSGYEATVCDWSTRGCGIEVNAVIDTNQVLRVQSPGFDAVATVRHARRKKFDLVVYGVEFQTIDIRLAAGSIYSAVA